MRSVAKLSSGFLVVMLLIASAWFGPALLAEENSGAQPAAEVKAVPMVTLEIAVDARADAADAEACDAEACEDAPCDTATEEANVANADANEEADPEREAVFPTHKQTKLIDVNPSSLAKASLRSFCLTPDGTVLAACSAEQGEVRVFSATGEHQDTWTLPVDPEAINVGSDGAVYVAGAGKLLRLDASGQVLLERDAPHIEDTAEKRAEVRQQIIERQQKSVETYQKMTERYDERLAKLQEKKAKLEEAEEEVPKSLDLQISNAQRMVEQWKSIVDQLGGAELTEEQLDMQVAASLQSGAAVASISEAGGEVFMATRESAGYGFCVWKMDHEFGGGEVIAKGLSGCCGQMDVQCCENGVYVAENSRHRVYHLSTSGEELGQWGHGAREGLEGFGSCCNPMNVAFGPDRTVYTAESGTGRIKRYTPEGKLIELVGKVDVVPGCKKVSIAVDKSGDRVYMLDITRHHIVMMERIPEGEEPAYTEYRTASLDADADRLTVEDSVEVEADAVFVLEVDAEE